MPTFYAHIYDGAMWGWVTRDSAGNGAQVAVWTRTTPAPGCDVTSCIEEYDAGAPRWRVVVPGLVLIAVPDPDTARELLAWLCPPQE